MGGEYASLRCVLPRGDLTCGFQEALLLLLPELPNLPAVNSSALVTMGIFKRRTDSSEPSCPLGPQLLSDCASLSSPFLAPFSKFKHFFLGFYSCFVFLKNTLQVSGRGEGLCRSGTGHLQWRWWWPGIPALETPPRIQPLYPSDQHFAKESWFSLPLKEIRSKIKFHKSDHFFTY